jgi:hypothetical protein
MSDLTQMEILTNIDPDSGQAVVVISPALVQYLGWNPDSQLEWVVDQDSSSIFAKKVNDVVDTQDQPS